MIIGISLLEVLWLSSCDMFRESDDCEPYSVKFFYLTDFEKSRCPYTGDENLLFISNKGDSVLMKGQGKLVTYHVENYGGMDCRGRDDKYENIKFTYMADVGIFNELEVISSQWKDGLTFLLNKKSIGSEFFLNLDSTKYYKYTINGNSIIARDISTIANPDTTYYNHTQGLIRYVQNDSLAWNIYRQ